MNPLNSLGTSMLKNRINNDTMTTRKPTMKHAITIEDIMTMHLNI